jgi:predicted unusual protein kinase regulating ubiquinone biosynthesis (AarF/ABC1/UbiB family)
MQDLGLLEMFTARAAEKPSFNQVMDLPAVMEYLGTSLKRELDFRQEAASIERMRKVLEPYGRLGVPGIYEEISTSRLLVMQEIQGVPIRQAPEGETRKEAARQLLESYYRQVLSEGFFHADPHPGNLMWWNDTIYFLDFGMIGEVDPDTREQMLLMLLAFWQEDAGFVAEILLVLSGKQPGPNFNEPAFKASIAELVARYRHLSLQELRLGPLLQEMTRISIQHDVRLPASMALTGKAFGQMQLATAELDPTLDPFTVAGSFFLKELMGQLRGAASPRRFFYEAQKLRLRLSRLAEGIERITGARPGAGLQVQVRGTESVEAAIRRAGRRVAFAVTAGSAFLAMALITSYAHVNAIVPVSLGIAGAVLTALMLIDVVRRRG